MSRPASPSSSNSKGWILGGKYCSDQGVLESRTSDLGPPIELSFDLPPTSTEFIRREDCNDEIIALDFFDDDSEDPFNWPKAKKAFISLLLCLMTLFVGLATTAYSSGISSMTSDFGVSNELGQLGLFTFNFACALAPLFLAPFCELVGRRVVYIGAYILFAVMFIGLALGKNIATIVVCRALLGIFGSVGTILVGGTFSDMYKPDNRAVPMATFSYVAILGTVGAPIYAGFIDETIGWRWIEGIQGLANIPLIVLVVLFLRETRGGAVLTKRAKKIRQETGDNRYKAKMELEAPSLKHMLHNSTIKAVRMLATEPAVLAFGLWISFAWFVTFLFLSVIPITFQEKRGWSEGVSGLPYISLCIGTTIGFGLNFFQIGKYKSISKANDRKVMPESRLYGAMFGAIWLPIGLFIYSFTQYGYLPWIAPTIALAPIAVGIFFIFESCYSFTSDCYGENSSSAIAGQGFMRNTLGAVAPLFASQFFHNVGSQYAGLILAILATILAMIPFVFFLYGPEIRRRSKMASSQTGDQGQKEKTKLYTFSPPNVVNLLQTSCHRPFATDAVADIVNKDATKQNLIPDSAVPDEVMGERISCVVHLPGVDALAETNPARHEYAEWKRRLKQNPSSSSPHETQEIWSHAVKIISSQDQDVLQRIPRDLVDCDNAKGLQWVEEVMDTHPALIHHSNVSFIDAVRSFLRVVANPALLDCLSSDPILSEGHQLLSDLTSALRRVMSQPEGIVNDELPALLDFIEKQRDGVTDSTKFIMVPIKVQIRELQRLRQRAIAALAPNASDATDGVAAAIGKIVRSAYPRTIEMPGSRHDSDSIDITKIKIVPTENEIRCDKGEFLPSTSFDSLYVVEGAERIFDIHFRLLRHDFSMNGRKLLLNCFKSKIATQILAIGSYRPRRTRVFTPMPVQV
ncbi:major facilitator superfamily domain-containing protein [Aspergillus cavernicola]|uniref:Major facilitator superfamily domain-containing protein n=1 Tax=Aspergillus cavernicola TaxID=176166 RepID=A0ABR4HCV0_9EURO